MAVLNYRKTKGFSLLELVIAVAILSAGITVILQALSFSAGVTGLTRDIIEAVFLAEDKIQQLEFKEKQKQTSKERVMDKSGKFEWGYDSELDTSLNLYRLNLKVSWQRLNRKEEIDLNTYLR